MCAYVSKVTSKYQTTIPKKVRKKLKITPESYITWEIHDKKVEIENSKQILKSMAGMFGSEKAISPKEFKKLAAEEIEKKIRKFE